MAVSLSFGMLFGDAYTPAATAGVRRQRYRARSAPPRTPTFYAHTTPARCCALPLNCCAPGMRACLDSNSNGRFLFLPRTRQASLNMHASLHAARHRLPWVLAGQQNYDEKKKKEGSTLHNHYLAHALGSPGSPHNTCSTLHTSRRIAQVALFCGLFHGTC